MKIFRTDTEPTERVLRVLVTGSRMWTDVERIRTVLTAVVTDARKKGERVVVIHGGAKGADTIAGNICKQDFPDVEIEVHPAHWQTYGKAAGAIRNKTMVDLGANVCLAFIKGNSPGATNCANTAQRAGIPVAWLTAEATLFPTEPEGPELVGL